MIDDWNERQVLNDHGKFTERKTCKNVIGGKIGKTSPL